MKIGGFISTVMLTGLLLIATLGDISHAQDEAIWMPDPNLRWFVRERLEIPDNIPMTPRDLLRLTDLDIRAKGVIANLQGLEYAVNLEVLNIEGSNISDLTPLTGLQNIRVLKFYDNNISDLTPLAGLVSLTDLNLTINNISDITPLTGLVNLTYLDLAENNISDITPLDGLVNLKVLILGENQIIDFIPLHGLVGIETLDLGGIPIDPEILQRLKPVDPPAICEIARDPIRPRIENRVLPSVFQACQDIINLPRLSREEGIASHDLFFCRDTLGWTWTPTPDGNLRLIGDREGATIGTDRMRAQNPNLLLLTSIEYSAAYDDEYPDDEYPEDSPYFLRDESGNRLKSQGWDHFFLDFTHPPVQERVIQQAIEVAKCGVFDGIAIDHWAKGFEEYITLEEEHAAKDRIMQGIRDAVGDDFLILVTTTNTIGTAIPRTAEYINGLFMETTEDYEGGYTYARLSEIESTLSWAEENLREPQINCLAGRGVRNEPLDSPRNIQWMRLFTTMSLTHSDGYVMFTMGGNLEHPAHSFEFLPGHADDHAQGKRHSHQNTKYWYDFWDAPLGQPVGGDETKAQLYKTPKGITIEGLFIREFTNGWAVYNRSGKSRMIQLPEKVSGIESGVENKRWHTIPDLDGEIYLKEVVPLDTTRPEVSIAVSSDTQDGAFDAVITFTEPVSDFGQTDVSISGTATATITAWTISADNTTYTATITPTTSGTLILNINEDVAADDTSNPNTPATQQTLTVQLIPKWDVNRDGQVNVLDLVAVANAFGKDAPDVNGDGVVNILDLVLVAQHFGDSTTAAPSILAMNAMRSLDAATVQAWIERAQLENDGSIAFKAAIANLQRLLASLIPEKTALLANYPNPFNPETWIPYHLANPSDVRITIYDTRGSIVRRLDLGHQHEGYYTTRSRAAYWDGRNAIGEHVASGIYFYQLQADGLSYLRKMVIVK